MRSLPETLVCAARIDPRYGGVAVGTETLGGNAGDAHNGTRGFLWGESTTPQGGGSSGTPYNPSATATSLQEAGWQVLDQEESPGIYADVTEVGYLETEAPDGEPIGLQFLESTEEAQLELDATVEEESPFDGTTEGNVLVFGTESESAEVTPENLEALRGQLS